MKRRTAVIALALIALLAAGCAKGPARQPDTGDVAPPAAEEETAPTTAAEGEGTPYQVVAEESEASYAVDETFLGQNRDAVAIGRTSAITGAIVIQDGVIQPSVVEVDLTTLKSDQERRDKRVQETLDTANHPKATFAIAGAEGNPVLKPGEETAVKLEGTMRIKGVDRPVTFDARVRLDGDQIWLNATTEFAMTDFGIEPPNVLNLIAVQDRVRVDVTFVGKAAG